ncbi:MAG TPA: prepilin-type N-terminal cleavage/methylation domain-containing protein [Acidimicrobiales bacterium]|nr:prepilin-type N-terminal cleavage/methylation domain-containing protein [Acidimicrobiales bacterium]
MRSTECRRDEGGFTLIELVVSSALTVLALGMVVSVLTSAQTTEARVAGRSVNNDQARLAVNELDRQIRSANLLYDPSTESPPYMSLLVYTQANSVERCVQWQIQNEQLLTRSWSSTWQTDGLVSSWRVVATNVVNEIVTPVVPAFALDTSQPTYGERILNIDLVVNDSTNPASAAELRASVTGRNTEYGYPATVCATVPPG